MVIVVLGMHRSGTSLLSSCLQHMGVRMLVTGKGRRDEDQPRGYWEDRDFKALNDKILQSAQGDWYKVPSRQNIMWGGMQNSNAIDDLIHRRHTGADTVHSEKWGWKDPRTCLTAEVWHNALNGIDEVRYIHIQRNEADIIRSLTTRSERQGKFISTEDQWRALIHQYEASVHSFLKRFDPPSLTIQFETLTTPGQSRVTLREIATFIGWNKRASRKAANVAVKLVRYK